MPVQLADYGIAVFAIALVAWIIVTVFAPRRREPDLVKVISDNTRAVTELSTLIRQQSELLQKQADILTEIRLETARKGARGA